MKKAVSLLASFALAFSLIGAPVVSFADEGENPSTDQEAVTGSDGIMLLADERDSGMLEYLDGLDGSAFSSVASPTVGGVDVKLTTLLVDPSLTGGLKATLSGASTQTVDFVAKSENELAENGFVAKFNGIAPGTYTLTVEGPGFVTYRQSNVQVQAAKRAVITLLDQFSGLLCSEEAHKTKGETVLVDVCAGHGLIPYGNFNGDGVIDNADAKILLQAVARVRANSPLSAEENARFGMNLVRDVLAPEDKGVIEETRPIEAPESDSDLPVTQSVESTDAQLTNGSALETYPEVELVANGNEDARSETSIQPQFRIANASEDVNAGEEDVTTAPLAETAQDQGEVVDEAVAGTVGRVKHTEPVQVGLNAFQKLATMKNLQTSAATVQQDVETSHMQAIASADTDLVLDSGKALTDVLFNDNGDMVKMYPVGDAAISESNPVQLVINTQGEKMDAIALTVPSDSPNAPAAGQIIVQRADNPDELITCDFVTEKAGGRISSVVDMRTNAYAARVAYGADDTSAAPAALVDEANGVITIDLKGQVPVKTITIKVTDTSSKKLAEIAQVEFLNGFEHKIPAPDLDIPTLNKPATVASKSITVSWNAQRNVTGYEVEISYNGATSIISTTKTSATIQNIAGKELVNYRTYTLRARSTNGEWRSPWSASIEATPVATGVPKKPSAPKIVGGYDSITVSWSAAEDAETHELYYREQAKSGEAAAAWIKVDGADNVLKYTISNLKLSTTYEAYVRGVNRHGAGPASDTVSATTTPDKVKVPWYTLYNKEVIKNEKGLTPFQTVIEKVEADYAQGGDPMNMVDGNYDTYVSGAKGGYHHGGTVTFKQPLDMDTIMLTGYQGQSLNIYDLVVQAWDENNQPIKPSGGNIKKSVLTYSSKTRTVMIRTEKLEGVKKIRVAYQRAVGNAWSASTIAELAFYNNTLYSDVMAVWADDEHTHLVDGMTEDKLLELQATVNTPDVIQTDNGAVSEEHPSKSVLLAELDNALIVCRNGSLRAPIKVDGNLNTVGAKRGVGGLNGWQPLGVAAAAGDEISVYVGRKGETNGAVPLALYVVQNHPDISNGFAVRLDSTGNKMEVGLNTFRIPDITSLNTERGGSLYVEYATSRGNNEQYTVRVAGGTAIPLLDVHNVTNAEQRMNLIREYVSTLKDYDPAAEHVAKGHVTVPDDTDYHKQDCIANATDIVMNDMMYSIPASQVASSIGVSKSSTPEQVEAAAQKLATSITAMEDMMTLFYQHKGFVKDNSGAAKYGTNNAWPTLHQNIRCVRTTGSVFMYAAGNHIGVQYGSTGLNAIQGVVTDANGKYQSGKYFGWGVAHEIGHEINNGAYTYAEVTNNYYAQLAQATDDLNNPKTRWGSYDSIYSRVSSGAKGMAMGKTGIAMYWQLHLAYDNGYNFKTYATAAEQFENLVFARIDAYGRNVSAAPKAAVNGHALTLSGANKDNVLMRLACAATQKDLLDFFKAWGLTPDAETVAYASQWPKEERAIQYQTDALRLYRIGDFTQLKEKYGIESNNIGNAAQQASVTVGGTLEYTPSVNRTNTTEDQTIKVRITGADTGEAILGYEIIRNGQVVGFLRANDFDGSIGRFDNSGSAVFADTINTVNNRVFKYEVRPVDKLLQRGNAVAVGEVKVSHPNSLSKARWTATTNMNFNGIEANETHSVAATVNDESVVYDIDETASKDPEVEYDFPEEYLPSSATESHPISKVIDGNDVEVGSGTVGAAYAGSDARITINFGETASIVGFRVKGASADTTYLAQTSLDGANWSTIPTEVKADGKIYFTRESDSYLYAHEAAYLRLTAVGQTSFALSEIDVFGPQGDDIEFLENGIGILDQEEVLGTNESNETATIPKGSLVFVGTYKGNPAYNAVLLFQGEDILGGFDADGYLRAKEVIFAPDVAGDALLGDVEEGYWVYYIEPQYLPANIHDSITSVKAELYRVNDAHTLEGQRLVADTFSVAVPDDLSKIDLSFGQVKASEPEAQSEEQQEGTVAETNIESQQLSGVDTAGAPSGYSYDLADLYGNEVTANSGQSSAAGTPLYGSTITNTNTGSAMGSPIYGTGSAMGTPIYDDPTPMAGPRKSNVLATATVRSLGETFIVVMEDSDAMNVAKSLR